MDNIPSIHQPLISYHELVQQISLIHLAGFQKHETQDEYNLMKKKRGIWAGTNESGMEGMEMGWGPIQLRMIFNSCPIF